MASFRVPIPTGSDWTLLFKFHKTTIVLPIEPTEPFPQVKERLFTALTSTPNLTQINGEPIPKSADSIQLAILNKATDTGSGWKSIETIDEDDTKASNGTSAAGVPRNSPKGVGLKEGGMLAFRFGGAAERDEWPVKFPSFDEEVQEQEGEENIPGLADALSRTAGSR